MSQSPFIINSDILFRLSLNLILILNILLPVNGYCWLPGRNPGFVAGPTITQINLAKVQVSWRDIVKSKECVDQFLVKYWKKGRPSNYKQSDLVGTSIDAVVLTGIIPKVEYVYQVIAREDKLVGIDYNRSPTTKFTTSRKHTPIVAVPKNEDSLNVVNVDSHKASEKYNPAINVIENTQLEISPPTNKIHGSINDQSDPLSFGRDYRRNYGEENFSVILILALVAAVMFGLIIIVGVIYNGLKRHNWSNASKSEADDSISI